MTPSAEARIRAAVAELGDALIAAVDESPAGGTERLYSVAEAAELTSLGRTALYAAISAGHLRSILVGRRRLIPSGALTDLAANRSSRQS